LFIPLSFLEKEAAHVEGFAKECAVVTHHRLEEKNGKLVPTGELDEPLVVRPTSEKIIGDAFSRWVQSYRDLPMLINQWANVVRWEMRTRLFLRTTEFLWQEGHTVHADEACARKEVMVAVEMYRSLLEEALAIPVIIGEKSPAERFPGAETTISLEAMMQDKKALQAGTSHYLGQNFARAQNIRFLDQSGELSLAHTTSWGVSTRLIGGMIMTHSDDDGLRIPPQIAPKQVVILPVIPKQEMTEEVLGYARRIREELASGSFGAEPLRIHLDSRDLRGGEKNWQWIKKGAPLRIEVGPRDIATDSLVVYRRDRNHREKLTLARVDAPAQITKILNEIQENYYREARDFRDANTVDNIRTPDEFRDFFTPKNLDKPEIHGGFVQAPWSGDEEKSSELLSELKVTVRCLPLNSPGNPGGKCVVTGGNAKMTAIFAKAY
jgi:prolyl-tRNA synthetase